MQSNKKLLNNFLIIQTSSLGDVVLSTALAETLHSNFPDSKIDFLIKKGYESLFDGHPFINKVITWDKKQDKYKNLLRITAEVRKNKYDVVIDIHRHFSTGLLTIFSGARHRSGFNKNPFSFGFTHKAEHLILEKGTYEHEIIRNHRLIDHLVDCKPMKPRLYPKPADSEFVKKWITSSYITVSPASLWFTKQYPLHKWVEFINRINTETQVYLLGASNDEAICKQIISQSSHKNITSLAGKLSFLQSSALMKGASMNFVNDSAPMHLASSVNAPITAIFCSTVTGFGFGPLSDDSKVVETATLLPCRPCGLHGHKTCPEKHFLCAESINSNQLLERIGVG